MKKIIILTLVLAVIFASFSTSGVFATENSGSGLYASRAELLSKLGIVSVKSEEEAKKSTISRGDFAQYVGRILKTDELGYADERYFIDVPVDHWAVDEINALTKLGIISIPENKEFLPDNAITVNEAVKMLIVAAGYSEYSFYNGGYPWGYIKTARQLGVSVESSDNPITFYETVDLIYEIMVSPMYEPITYSSSKLEFRQSEETILSRYWDMYLFKGVVTYASGISIDGKGILDTDEVRIDALEYSTDVDLFDKVGAKCEFIVKDNKDAKDKIFMCRTISDENEYFTIDIADFERFDVNNYRVNYASENGSTKYVSIPQNAVVLKNGKDCDNIVNGFKDLKQGKIVFADADGNGNYEYVLIYNYYNIVYDKYAETTGNIYDKVISSRYITVDPLTTDRKVVIKNAKGSNISLENLVEDNVLSVYESDIMIYVCVSTALQDYEVFGTRTINGIYEVRVGKNVTDTSWMALDLDYAAHLEGSSKLPVSGESGTFYTDAQGKIAYIEKISSGLWEYAYLLGINEPKVFDRPEVWVLTQDGSLKVYKLDSKIRIDGERKSSFAAILEALNKDNYGKQLSDGEDEVTQQVLRVRYSTDGESIKEIDTENKTAGETANSLQRTLNIGAHSWNYHTNCYGEKALKGNNTILFSVPKYANMGSAPDYQFYVNTQRDIGNTGDFVAESFKTDLYSGYEDVIVLYRDYTSEITYKTAIYLVDEKIQTLDTDGEIIEEVSVWTMGGLERQYKIDPTKGIDIDTGDIIQFTTGDRGYIDTVDMWYDYSKKDDPTYIAECDAKWATNNNNIRSDKATEYGNLMRAYIKYDVDGVFKTAYTKPTTDDYKNPGEYDYIAPTNIQNVLVYDTVKREVRLSGKNELMTAETLEAGAGPYFLYMRLGIFTGAVVYR